MVVQAEAVEEPQELIGEGAVEERQHRHNCYDERVAGSDGLLCLPRAAGAEVLRQPYLGLHSAAHQLAVSTCLHGAFCAWYQTAHPRYRPWLLPGPCAMQCKATCVHMALMLR